MWAVCRCGCDWRPFRRPYPGPRSSQCPSGYARPATGPHTRWQTGNVIAGLRRDLFSLPPLGLDHHQACRSGQAPSGSTYRVYSGVPSPAAARPNAALVLVHGLVEVVVAALENLGLFDSEGLDHGFVRRRLVALERQHIVGLPVADRLCHPLLATHGINRHDTAFQRHRLDQGRNSRDPVGPIVPGQTQSRAGRVNRSGEGPVPGWDRDCLAQNKSIGYWGNPAQTIRNNSRSRAAESIRKRGPPYILRG